MLSVILVDGQMWMNVEGQNRPDSDSSEAVNIFRKHLYFSLGENTDILHDGD